MHGVDPLVERMRGFGTTIFAEMSALAVRTDSVNLGQGFPDTDGPPRLLERRGRGDPHRPQPVPARPRHPRTAPGDRRAPAAPLRPRLRPRHRGARHRRRHRGHRRRVARARRTGRRGRGLRAVLRLLRRLHRARRRIAPHGHVRRATATAGRSTPPRSTPRSPHAPRRSCSTPRTTRPARCSRRTSSRRSPHVAREHDLVVVVRRGVRAPDLRRTPARADRDAARHARAHGHDLQRRQDVQRHRLEDRLGLRAARAADRGPHRQAVPHLRQRRAVPAGGRRRARQHPGRHRRTSSQTAARPALRRARRPRLRRRPSAGHVLRDGRRRTRRASTSAANCPSRAGVVAIPSSVFYDSDAGDHFVRFAFCKRPEVLHEALRPTEGAAMKVAIDPARHRLGGRRRHARARPADDREGRGRRRPADRAQPRCSRPGSRCDPERIAEDEGGPSEQFLLDQAAEHDAYLVASHRAARRGRAVPQQRDRRRPGRHGAPLREDPPVHLLRRARALRRGQHASSPSQVDGAANVAFSSVMTCDSRTSSGRCADDTDVYVVVANWPEPRSEHWRVLLRARAIENQAYVVGVNRVGTGEKPGVHGRFGDHRPARTGCRRMSCGGGDCVRGNRSGYGAAHTNRPAVPRAIGAGRCATISSS